MSNLSDVCSSSNRDGVGGSGTGTVNSGDWICGDVTCSHTNFARRQQCKNCKRDRSLERSSSVGSSGSNKKKLGTEIGKAAAEKSRGLFSAEDWQCNKCANVNWARRSTCNMCNAPKFCDVEERTGFGGGYNDRGVVEYKEREESDSEYDEFGRLKKRGRNTKNGENRIKNNSNIEKTIMDEEEDDEEEDGDDGDLAKYNLFSDDEEVVPSVALCQNSKVGNENVKGDVDKCTDRRSRSRTRSEMKRRQSYSSSEASSSSSTSTSSTSSSSTSSSSGDTLSQLSNSLIKKRSYSRSRSRSVSRSLLKPQRSTSREGNTKKRARDDKLKTAGGEYRRVNLKSCSKSRSSDSSRSPPTKRDRSRNQSLSRKNSRSPRSHRKRTTRSRSGTPKRRR